MNVSHPGVSEPCGARRQQRVAHLLPVLRALARNANVQSATICRNRRRPRRCSVAQIGNLLFRRLALVVSLIGSFLVALTGCSRSGEEKETEKPAPAAARVKHGANGETVVALDAETQQRIGLKSEQLESVWFQPEVKGYGRVLDPASLVALVAELDAARASAQASGQEFERLKVLSQQNNASIRALQAAEASARRDELLVESVRARLILGWGRKLAGRDDLAAFVKTLAAGEAAIVRIDLAFGESVAPTPTSVRLVVLADEEHSLAAEFLDSVPSVEPQMQGSGFLCLLKGKPLPFGTAVTGHFQIAGEAVPGVRVPRGAVLRQEGRAWVYVQIDERSFARRLILLEHADERGWIISGGVTDKDRIVVVGAQAMLSEELGAASFLSGARE